MEGTYRIPEGGIFPHNLIGRVMKRFTEEGWPYPEEVCTFWTEAVGLYQTQDTNASQYDAEAHLLAALGLWKSSYIPEIWHDELKHRQEAAKEAELKEQLAKLKLQAEAATILKLEQPNPPRAAQLQIKHITRDGNVAYYPLSYGPVLLKEDGNWKYNDTATIPSSKLNEVIRELESIQERIFLNDQAGVQTLAAQPCGTPMMAGKSSPSTA